VDEPPSSFPDVNDFAASGPFATAVDTSGQGCTIHRPVTLGEEGRKHPVILWGNGTFASPSVYQGVLSHWASHGFIAAAANTSNAGSGQEMLACLEYLTGENDTAGSAYERHVDLERIGASGHSQGGAGTLMVGRDPRIDVTAPLQPYIANPLGGFERSSVDQQNGPMFLMSGSEDTIAAPTPNQAPIFEETNVPVFWGNLLGADHLASAIGDITAYRGPATAWFRMHLMDDASARELFYGQACGLCTDADWAVQTKELE
jgi:hypothetical protein